MLFVFVRMAGRGHVLHMGVQPRQGVEEQAEAALLRVVQTVIERLRGLCDFFPFPQRALLMPLRLFAIRRSDPNVHAVP